MKRALLLSTMLLAACAVEAGPVGQATATITQVPAGVACVQIQVVGSRTVVKNADVMPGVSSVVALTNLPAGADTFSAVAFGVPCGAILGATANWASDAVVAIVAAGGNVPVTLAMQPVGGATVGVDFPGDGGDLDGGIGDGGIVDLAKPDLTSFPDGAVVDLACVPLTKAQACPGQVCGTAPNGCGGSISCGTCAGRCCIDSCVPLNAMCP